MCQRFGRRWASEERRLLCLLARDLAHDEVVQGIAPDGQEDAADVDVWGQLQGRYVAIYSLTESAARRVKEFLEQRVADVRVELSSDRVGSERLREMARNADFFIMAVASAKHAATGIIRTYRGDRPLLQPAGKGSASMLKALRKALEETRGN